MLTSLISCVWMRSTRIPVPTKNKLKRRVPN
nr:MAG TPA: hypothetical protein [Caudoviricetes sp.]DAP74447.1 MAG TPA: hypothetical protein [Caudoviricetes sp.]